MQAQNKSINNSWPMDVNKIWGAELLHPVIITDYIFFLLQELGVCLQLISFISVVESCCLLHFNHGSDGDIIVSWIIW